MSDFIANYLKVFAAAREVVICSVFPPWFFSCLVFSRIWSVDRYAPAGSVVHYDLETFGFVDHYAPTASVVHYDHGFMIPSFALSLPSVGFLCCAPLFRQHRMHLQAVLVHSWGLHFLFFGPLLSLAVVAALTVRLGFVLL